MNQNAASPSASQSSPDPALAPPAAPAPDRCQFAFSDGRTCRMLRWSKHRSFCLPHAREEQQLLAADLVGRQLVSPSGDFTTATDVNHVLGKVFTLRAKNKISCRDAATFAYISQLLLQSLPGVRRERTEASCRAYLSASAFDDDNDAGDGNESENEDATHDAGDDRADWDKLTRPQ